MADSFVTTGVVRGLADDSGDFADGFVQITVDGTGGTWTLNSQSPGSPAVLALTSGGRSISGTDNRLVRMDGTTGIQDSGATIEDGGDMYVKETADPTASNIDLLVANGYSAVNCWFDADAALPLAQLIANSDNAMVDLRTDDQEVWLSADTTANRASINLVGTFSAGSPYAVTIYADASNTMPYSMALPVAAPIAGQFITMGTYPRLVGRAFAISDIPAATEGQIIDFGGGSGAARVTDSPKIGGDTKIYARGGSDGYLWTAGGTGIGSPLYSAGAPSTTASGGTNEIITILGDPATAGSGILWLRFDVPEMLLGRTVRVTGAGAKIVKEVGASSKLDSAAVYNMVFDASAATHTMTAITTDGTDRCSTTPVVWFDGAFTMSAASAGTGPIWLGLTFTTAAEVTRIKVHPNACYITLDTL